MKNIILCAPFLLTVGLSAETIDLNKPVSPTAPIYVENLAGSVVVHGWDQAEVRVTGTVGADVEDVEVDVDEGEVDIEVEITDSRHGNKDVAAHLEIWVPAGTAVNVETVSAEVTVDETTGAVEVESMSGNVTVRGRPAYAEVESVSGTVDIRGEDTAVDVETVSGSIQLHGVAGEIDVSSVSGSIDVVAGYIHDSDIESVNGSIDLAGRLGPESSIDIEGHSGTVTLALPSDTSAYFDLSTFSGTIENELGGADPERGDYLPGSRLKFSLGDGGADVSVETFSANIRLVGQSQQ